MPLQLAGQTPLATGNWKFVFQHPHHDEFLVKVMRRDLHAELSRTAWYKTKAREGRYLLFSRELHEFFVAEANSDGSPLPIPKVIGLTDTDLGLGLVVEKLCGRDGALAPTLRSKLFQDGFLPHYEAMLFDLITAINRHRIVLIEFSPVNILFVDDQFGQERLILIDGYGDSSLLPVHSLSERTNSRRNLRKFRRMIRKASRLYPARSDRHQPAL